RGGSREALRPLRRHRRRGQGPAVAQGRHEHVSLPGSVGAWGKELVRAVELARIAGTEVVRLRTGDLTVEMKPGDEPVTVADRRASELIVEGLLASFPDDALISEELP